MPTACASRRASGCPRTPRPTRCPRSSSTSRTARTMARPPRDAIMHPWFAGNGYAAVRVDQRGSGDSDGVLLDEYLPQEQDDALEVLAWLAAQPWCTGRVGIIGKSWGGFNGLQIAARRPPELGGVISVCSTDDRYATDVHYMGGCLLGADMLPWASTMLAFNARPPDPAAVGERWRELWLERLEQTPPFAQAWIAHQRRDAFWKHGSVCEDFDAIQVPVYMVGGWQDAYTDAVFRFLGRLRRARQGARRPLGSPLSAVGRAGPGNRVPAGVPRFWDHCLKGNRDGVLDEPGLRVFMQEWVDPTEGRHAERPGRWVAEPSWPPRDAAPPSRAASARRRGSRRAGRRGGRANDRRLAADRHALRAVVRLGCSGRRSRAISGPRTGARCASRRSHWPSGWRSSALPRRSSRSPPTGRSRLRRPALRRRAFGLVAARDPRPPQPHAPRLARGARAARAGAPLRGRRAAGSDRPRVRARASHPRLRLADVLAVRVAKPRARHAHARRRSGEQTPAARARRARRRRRPATVRGAGDLAAAHRRARRRRARAGSRAEPRPRDGEGGAHGAHRAQRRLPAGRRRSRDRRNRRGHLRHRRGRPAVGLGALRMVDRPRARRLAHPCRDIQRHDGRCELLPADQHARRLRGRPACVREELVDAIPRDLV